MADLMTLLKNIPTEKLIRCFSKLSLDIYHSGGYRIELLFKGKKVLLTGWDIAEIEYLSIVNSNDYRRFDSITTTAEWPARVVNGYQGYMNKTKIKESWKSPDSTSLVRDLLLGMYMEQSLYQWKAWMNDMYNRNYHILVAGDASPIKAEEIVQEVLGMSVKEYSAVASIIYALSGIEPEVRKVLEVRTDVLARLNTTLELVDCFLDYYSVTYEEVRASNLKHLFFYSKPFIKTDRSGCCLASNCFLTAFTSVNGLYWLLRDYYCVKGSQAFTNGFGQLFENYICEIASAYCAEGEWNQLPQGKKKGADFVFQFPQAIIIVESKSTLLGLPAKQQLPDDTTMEKFVRCIKVAYSQLQETYIAIQNPEQKPVLKIVLLYDTSIKGDIVETACPNEAFAKDPDCHVMTIREFEYLLHLWKDDKAQFEIVLHCFLEDKQELHKNFTEPSYSWSHFTGSMDYMGEIRLYD